MKTATHQAALGPVAMRLILTGCPGGGEETVVIHAGSGVAQVSSAVVSETSTDGDRVRSITCWARGPGISVVM